MAQQIFKDGTDQYVMIRLGSVDNSSGAQSPILGSAEGGSLLDIISFVVVTWSEYKKADIVLDTDITWNASAGMWKVNIAALSITRYGTAWINITGSADEYDLSIIPAAIEISVLSTPDISTQIIDGTLSWIEIERLMAAVICGNESRVLGTSTFTGLDGITPRVVASINSSGRTISTRNGDK